MSKKLVITSYIALGVLIAGGLALARIDNPLGAEGTGFITVTHPSLTYATSTAWTGTTTIPLGPAYSVETWNNVKCYTDTGTLFVQFSDGTNHMDDLKASTTVGTITFTANNSFTASEKREVRVGTPASTPTKISCTVKKTTTL